MLILAIDTSAKAVSAALLKDGELLAEYYQNSGQTHSRTLMKIVEDMLANCDRTPSDVDVLAWSNGPGSFTGIRIGAAAAKGFCWGRDIPCVPVSTLEAMAYCCGRNGVICACMDARRAQVYNAVFRKNGAEVVRMTEDRAISLEDLSQELKNITEDIFLVGDGANLCYNTLKAEIPNLRLMPEHLRQQRASGVALAAYGSAVRGETGSAGAVVPEYLRLSQAERERLEKQNK